MAGGIKDKFEDWMVRISFAEADQSDMGMALTGLKEDWKTKIAFDKIMGGNAVKLLKLA